FEPDTYQLECTAKILNGCDIFCISATGNGKSALIYMPVLVHKGTITLVMSPTNFLESDMVANLEKEGIPALAINSETLAAAKLSMPVRDLWEEARTGQHHVILIGPETMQTSQYNSFILNTNVHARLWQLTVDKVHLVDEWGVDFRTPYQDISHKNHIGKLHCTK
ncbi:hypothetical protein L208DRAFT_1232820, partial [Tricholoma matsutake]